MFAITWRDFQPRLKFRKPHVIALKFQLSDCVFTESRWWSHFSPQLQILAWAETSHVIATKFHPGGRAEISAHAEAHHVIGP